MNRWKQDSEKQLNNETAKEFGVIIDMKNLQPLSTATKEIMISGQKLYKAKGMKRSTVILNNGMLCVQFKNLAIVSGIYAYERYIDSSKNPNASDIAVKWVKDGIDTDN